jgi:crotonobetainyl-CoA:carnitine CoA-transferase CaiB-like acyl-CoA transferase
MLDAAMAFMPDAFAAFAESGVEVGPETRSSHSHSFVFRCADEKLLCVHVGGPEHFWRALVAAVGGGAIDADPRFAERPGRVAHFPALIDALAAIFQARPRAEWLERLGRHDVPASEVHTIAEAIEDPEVRHSRILDTVQHPLLGPLTVMRRAARIDGLRDQDPRPPPMLGEHTEHVLRRAAYTDAEIAELRDAGAV